MSDLHLAPLALSVRQPWAWAIIHGGKDIENRSKRAITLGNMEGSRRIGIHASLGMTREEYEDAAEFMETLGLKCPRPDELVRGAIVGLVTVTGCVKHSASPWFFGPWGLTLTDAVPVVPLPCKGELGLFDWRRHLQRADPAPAAALPWMVAWPERAVRKGRNRSGIGSCSGTADLDLFGQAPTGGMERSDISPVGPSAAGGRL